MAKQAKIEQWLNEAGLTLGDVKFDNDVPVIWRRCGRCGGSGRVWAVHIDNGVCFACGGRKGRFVGLQSVAASARAANRKQAQRVAENQRGGELRLAKKRPVAAAARILLAENVGLAAVLAGASRGILRSFAEQLGNRGTLSEKQIEMAFKVAADMEAQDAIVLVEVPEDGRVTVEGEILSVKEVYNHFTGGDDLKMLVMDSRGFKVFGSVPSSIIEQADRGVKIRFDAKLEAKELGFGFFKRPTKAEVMV